MGKLTPEETVREHNRGRKAVDEGCSCYWSEPWAYPFESDELYVDRRSSRATVISFNNTAKIRVKLRHHD